MVVRDNIHIIAMISDDNLDDFLKSEIPGIS